jgi:hypothetical protein
VDPVMKQRSTRDLIALLRETLEQLENDQKLALDDPTLVELKRHIVRAMADLTIQASDAGRKCAMSRC